MPFPFPSGLNVRERKPEGQGKQDAGLEILPGNSPVKFGSFSEEESQDHRSEYGDCACIEKRLNHRVLQFPRFRQPNAQDCDDGEDERFHRDLAPSRFCLSGRRKHHDFVSFSELP